MIEDSQGGWLIERLRDSITEYAAARGMTWGEAVEDYERLSNYVHELFRGHVEDGEPLPEWLALAVEQIEAETEPKRGRLDRGVPEERRES